MAELEQDWDPPEGERVHYRHVTTGDLGYKVRRDGKMKIRLDRPLEEIVKPFQKGVWVEDKEHRPLSKFQVAQIAFEADRPLCLALGYHDKAKREWMSLSDDQRIAWAETGPTDPLPRMLQYRAIMKVNAPLMKQ